MDALIAAAIDFLLYVGASSLYHILILFGPGLVLGFLLNRVSRFTESSAWAIMGLVYFWVFESFGTVIHELGHLVARLPFGHKVIEVKFFIPDPKSPIGGYVHFSYNQRSVYQNLGMFFGGVGPVLLGTTVIYLAGRFLFGPGLFAPLQSIDFDPALLASSDALSIFLEQAANQILAVLQSIFSADNIRNWRFYVFLYVAFSVGSSMALSPPDLRGARIGFATIAAVIFALNFGAAALGVFVDGWFLRIAGLYAGFYAVMAFALIVVSVFAVVFGALRFLAGR